MTFPSPSVRLQRFLGGAVAALLTANAFAVASLVSDDSSASDRLGRPSATGDVIVPTAEAPTVVLITTADGRTFLADPATAEGRRAIQQANDQGSTVRTVTVPPQTSTPGTKTPGVETVLDLIGDLLSKGSNPPGGGGTGTGPDDDGGLVEINPGLVEELLQDPIGTATSIVQGTPSTLTSVVNGAPSTVSSVVNQAPVTLPPATLPPTTVPPVTLPPTTTVPPPSLLGQIVTTVVSVVNSVTPPPTTPPTTTPPPSNPVCTLLVLC